jgi:hypothetical protein
VPVVAFSVTSQPDGRAGGKLLKIPFFERDPT